MRSVLIWRGRGIKVNIRKNPMSSPQGTVDVK